MSNDLQNEQVVLQELDRQLDNFIDAIFLKAQEKLISSGKVDTGVMVKTANIEREFLKKTIVYPAKYADYVHFGRLPGSMPPVKPLERWVRRKLQVDEKEARRVAFAIAMAIKERGIMPFPFLQESVNEVIMEQEA